ncbi:hypothetical protein NEFER03_2067 [Nematocida sp. LUAm3]|nr:hypothetical protein NEFER03_2067 [Nematocida sp. LUAm3]KAI5176215.1 hypothetical protein NEFER02_2021 [Nematocida sp. LUAm2]KAI5179203.1 hypothetical protein NEFER01_2060 [Nematocida sp. LUAm1]
MKSEKKMNKSVGLDLALKNTELKEEIKALKEKQNELSRDSLKHKYMRYRAQAETERILNDKKRALEGLIERIDSAVSYIRTLSPEDQKPKRDPLKSKNKE